MNQSSKARDLFQLIDRDKFDALCLKWNIDKGVRTFSTWEHVRVLIMAYLMKLESHREIETVIGVARSTFSDANRRRSSGFYEDFFRLILSEVHRQSGGRKLKRAIRTLLAIDSTEIRVHGSISRYRPWKQKATKDQIASAKLHLVWNVDDILSEDFRITPSRRHDSKVARQFKIDSEKMYVFDRAYNEIEFWWEITENKSDFVSRLKDYPKTRIQKKILIEQAGEKTGVLAETLWKPTNACFNYHSRVPKNFQCRHIIYKDPNTKKVFDFVTSDFKSPAQNIADIYKLRWAVELIFRWFKGHLNIRYLSPRNPNAVRIQLVIALIVQLLIQLLRIVERIESTPWECLRAIRTNLAREGCVRAGLAVVQDSKPKPAKDLTF